MERIRIYIVGAVLVAVVAVFAFVFYQRQQEAAAPEATVAETHREVLEEPAVGGEDVAPELQQPPVMPEIPRWDAADVILEESDPVLRGIVRELSGHQLLAEMLAVDNLAATFVAAVDNIAEGATPAPHLAGLAPKKTFSPGRSGETLVFDAENAGRYDLLTGLMLSLSPADCVELYRTFYPQLSQAYRDLGYPEGDFHLAVARALRHLRETPTPGGPVLLERKVTTWAFADPRLEALSPAQKQLLRTGPENLRRIRQWLTEVEGRLIETAP